MLLIGFVLFIMSDLKSLCVFGSRDAGNFGQMQAKITLLYGVQELTDKEKKKLAKMEKFQQKLEKKVTVSVDDPELKKKSTAKEKVVVEEFAYVSPPVGERKDVTGNMPASYDPKIVEDGWYSWWVKEGFFKPEYNEDEKNLPCQDPDNKNFTIIIPPPNVTGSLHMGHALTNAIEDSLTRWNRMRGKRTLWNPGCDHAGIATQSVVEKKIKREQNKSRHDLGREKFIQEVWKWKDANGSRIYEQLKGLGASLDWDREAFTMSERCCKAVEAAFIQLHEKGLIYRSDRLVNWSCQLTSAISDIEVDKRELLGRTLLAVPGYDEAVEFGVITSFAYKIEGSDEEIVVATTRIETMLGDVAVAVHPTDVRYKHLVGKMAIHPFISRKLLIVADTFVDPNFGTGAVKITPAHDQNDYECGKRFNLPFISVINKTGNMMDNCGQFSGLKRFDARKKVLEALKGLSLFRGQAENPMIVPVCSRSKDIIEPLQQPQWFCDCDGMARRACEAVENGSLKLIPEMHEKTWFHWLKNIKPWCISRQLWWGHRIPAFFISIDDANIPKGETIDNKYWVSATSVAEARTKAALRFNVNESKISLSQDEDVLDTWFSSGLYPISIFGWPNETPDLKKYFPGHLLETGHDILFFWVARMVMMCQELTGELPFKEVYLHSIIRDAQGRKMSKSLGNVIDPMDVRNGITLDGLHQQLIAGNLDPSEVEKAKRGQSEDFPNGIPECGIDALRFALCSFALPGKDINLDVRRIEGYRNFCNKIWNAVKFVKHNLGEKFIPAASAIAGFSNIDKWILNRLSVAIVAVDQGFKTYDFPKATTAIYSFWLYDFCDYYLEMIKPIMSSQNVEAIRSVQDTLFTCSDTALRLLSPFMPFLTEELWQRLPRVPGNKVPLSICVASFPVEPLWSNNDIDGHFNFVKGIVVTARSLRSDYLPPGAKPEIFVKTTTQDKADIIASFSENIKTLIKAGSITLLSSDAPVPAGCAVSTRDDVEIHLMIKGLVDPQKEVFRLEDNKKKLQLVIDELEKEMKKSAGQLPEHIMAAKIEKAAKVTDELKILSCALSMFTSLLEK